MAQPKTDPPRFWIVAGPNGSGKSTLHTKTSIEGFGLSVWIINPDLLTARLQEQEGLAVNAANAQALDRIWDWLTASIRAHQTVGVETVLSTDKYRKLVQEAKTRGFEIRLIYVTLKNADLNVERVRTRARNGGHDVPEDKIRSRRQKSFDQLPWFLEHADSAAIYDNSTEPRLIGTKKDGVITIDPRAPAEIKAAAQSLAD